MDGAGLEHCWIFVLMLSSDQSRRIACISRGFGPPRATGAAEQRLALPNQRHDP